MRNIVGGKQSWIPNLWNPEQPIIKLNTGMDVDSEMSRNVIESKQKGDELFNEFLSRFSLNSNSTSNLKYNDPIKKQQIDSFKPSKKEKRKHSFLLLYFLTR